MHSAASDQVLHCLLMSHKKESRLIHVNLAVLGRRFSIGAFALRELIIQTERWL